jgi:ferredoxin
MSDEIFPCILCNVSCENNYITIEKNLTGEQVIFLDMCVNCFECAADEFLKYCVYEISKYHRCPYCKDYVINDTNQKILSSASATGNYVSVYYKSIRSVFIHPNCYEENIGL